MTKQYFRIVVSSQGREYVPGKPPDDIFFQIDKLVLKYMKNGLPEKEALKKAHNKVCRTKI